MIREVGSRAGGTGTALKSAAVSDGECAATFSRIFEVERVSIGAFQVAHRPGVKAQYHPRLMLLC